jgi:GDP-L-fucose synthase
MHRDAKIYVAGHRGLVGSALLRKLDAEGFTNVVYRTHDELDLTRQAEVEEYLFQEKPEYVFVSAARAGGIKANMLEPASFYYINAMIATNVIDASHRAGVTKLLYLGSSCIYPRIAPQPLSEDQLLDGKLEPTNEAYAIAKIAGLRMCDYYREQYGSNFISAMPTSLYGINDNFDLTTGHLLPSMMRKFHEAKLRDDPEMVIWGTGTVYRELMDVDDLANAMVFLMEKYDEPGHINVGTGLDYSINEYADMIRRTVGYKGEIVHDLSQPDGIPRKLLDISKIRALGWKPEVAIEDGIAKLYAWFSENYDQIMADLGEQPH